MKHEQAREEGAGHYALVSQSKLPKVTRGEQWELSRQGSLSLPQLQDVLWGNARDAHVWVEDPCRGSGLSAVGRDATGQLAGGRRDHGTQIGDHQRVAEAGGDSCRGHHPGADQRSASELGRNR